MKLLKFIALLLVVNAMSQCPTSSITFRKQTEVDAFISKYPNCQIMEYGITISGDKIRNLDGLRRLRQIKGMLQFYGSKKLENIQGLDSLERVNSLKFRSNTFMLTDFNGFFKLDTIDKDFNMNQARGVKKISGFNQLKYVGGKFGIFDCNEMDSITGFNQLNYIKSSFSLGKLNSLQTFESMSNLEHVGYISINENPQLKNLDGFKSLKDFRITLEIINNKSLKDISGLDSVTLKPPGGREMIINISQNPELSNCATYFVCNTIDNHKVYNYLLGLNKKGCNKPSKIIETCSETVHRIKITE